VTEGNARGAPEMRPCGVDRPSFGFTKLLSSRLGAGRACEKSTAQQGSGSKLADFSLHSYHYAPHKKPEGRLDAREGGAQALRAESPSQNHAILASLINYRAAGQHRLLLLATIPLSPTGS